MKDLLVIGAGPGGYVAAIRAAQLGLTVTVVERDACGGTCLNYGCIPTKALYKDAQVAYYLQNAGSYGFKVDGFSLELDKVRREKDKIVKTLSKGVEYLFKQNAIDLVRGEAKILGAGKVQVTAKDGTQIVEAKNILIATGSKAAMPPIEGINTPGVITSKEALEMKELPAEIVIIGGGVIGIEFAGIYAAFGAKVTVVEFMPNIIPTIDTEITDRLQSLLSKKGINFLLSTKVSRIEKTGDVLTVSAEKDGEAVALSANSVLVSTGRVLDVDGLGLDEAGITYDRGGVKVDEQYQTNVPGIYAIGDVIGGVQLAHVASEEGKVCVERMAGHFAQVDYTRIPSAVFTFPEVASIGQSEEQLKAEGTPYTVGRFQLRGNGKALTMHDADGMMKVLADDKKQQILGVHVVGPNASDVLAEAATAMGGLFTVEEAASIMHGHPTLSEIFEETLGDILGNAIHIPPKKK